MDAKQSFGRQSGGVKAFKSVWGAYTKFGRSVRLHLNAGVFLLAFVLASQLLGTINARPLLVLAILSWVVAIYLDIATIYKSVYQTLIGKGFLAVAFVAATIVAHSISGIVVNTATGVDPAKFPNAVNLLSLMCIPFFALTASIPIFFVLLILGPLVILILTQDLGTLNFITGRDRSGEKKPFFRVSMAVMLVSWSAFTGFAYQLEKLNMARYDTAMQDLAKSFIFNFEMYARSPCKTDVDERVGFLGDSQILVAKRSGGDIAFRVISCVKP